MKSHGALWFEPPGHQVVSTKKNTAKKYDAKKTNTRVLKFCNETQQKDFPDATVSSLERMSIDAALTWMWSR